MANIFDENNPQSSADELLSFVSNASRELKDMLGKVDTEEKGEPASGTGYGFPLTGTPMSSPVPSPTPSCVSSVSDQEVPCMSPRFFGSFSQKRSPSKRSRETLRDVPFSNYSAKIRRTDSIGDYDDSYQTYATMETSRRSSRLQSTSQDLDYLVHHLGYQKSLQSRQSFDQLVDAQLSYHQHPVHPRTSQTTAISRDNFTVRFGGQAGYSGHAVCFPSLHSNNVPPSEPVPDFADLVSWMLAEDFLDAESLSALLLRC